MSGLDQMSVAVLWFVLLWSTTGLTYVVTLNTLYVKRSYTHYSNFPFSKYIHYNTPNHAITDSQLPCSQ